MAITINGSGTISGISSGGLNDGIITPAELSTGSPSWDTSGNLSFNSGYGSNAVAYGCRAWVNFNGTGTVAIRASGNVSSITDNGTGDYTVNFTTAMPDGNYAISTIENKGANGDYLRTINLVLDYSSQVLSTSNVRLSLAYGSNTMVDSNMITVAIFR